MGKTIEYIKCEVCKEKFPKPRSKRRKCVRCYTQDRNEKNKQWAYDHLGVKPQKPVSSSKMYSRMRRDYLGNDN